MLAAIFILSGMTMLAACSRIDERTPDDNGDETPVYDLNDVAVDETGVMSMVDLYSLLLQKATEGNDDSDAELAEWAQRQIDAVKAQEKAITDSLNNVYGTNSAAYGENWDGKGDYSRMLWYQWATLRYKAPGVDGTMKELSELVVWPYGSFHDAHPDHVIIGCHCTITSNAERPTNFSNQGLQTDVNMLACFAHSASQEALVIIPDYEGYGSTHGAAHPYCNRDVTAVQVIEGAKAALEWYNKKVKDGKAKALQDNWKSVAVGYSQGGAVAAGVLRYYQEHNETGLNLVGAVCGDGPYDPLATLQQYIKDDKIFMPVAPALLLKGAVDTNPEMIALGCKYEDFCTQDFMNTLVFKYLKEKYYNTDDLQQEMLAISCKYNGGFKMYCYSNKEKDFVLYTPEAKAKDLDFDLSNGKGKSYCTVDQCFKDGVIQYFKNGTVTGEVPEAKLKALRDCLAANQLFDGYWRPGDNSGFTFFHSVGDEVVPICNLLSVDAAWYDYGKTFEQQPYYYLKNDSDTKLHVATGKSFYVVYVGAMVSAILKGKWQGGRWIGSGGWW